MKRLLFVSILLCLQLQVEAQTDPITQIHGARSQAMGNLRVHGNDAWSYFNNPGGLAKLEQSIIAVGIDQRYGLKELGTVDFTGSWITNYGTWATGISRFGGKLFNQHSIGLAFANQLGIVSIGGKIEWFQTQIQGFGTANSLIFSLGGILELGPKIDIGASIFNLNRGKLSSESTQHLPTGISLGLNYTPIPQLEVQLELEKDIMLKPVVKLGLEYSLKEWVHLRTGINSNPSRLFFGIGISRDQFSFDYAYGQNQALGSTHHLSLAFKLAEK